jgi:hypothetical protein
LTLTQPPVAASGAQPAAVSVSPPGLLAAAAVIFLVGGIGPNSDLALAAIVDLIVGAILLWRPGESPILLFIFCWQWIQASMSIFHSNWLGVDINSYSRLGGFTAMAVVLTLAGLIVFATGLRLGAGAKDPKYAAQSRAVALGTATQKWFWLYLYSAAAAFAALAFANTVPALSQGMIALASLKWACFYMLAYAALSHGTGDRKFFIIAFALEFVQGFGGYFSDFKIVLFVSLMAMAASGARVSVAAIISFACVGALALVSAIVWTAVKEDYRNYVSGGARQQIVTADYTDRMEKLFDLVSELDDPTLRRATDGLLRRISYVEFFGVTLSIVPLSVPYQQGAIWFDAVSRPFMPRILFPDKAAIGDSERTNAFTGGLAGNSAGTSISLGYMAESYIDFGVPGMMAPIFLFGLFCGLIYRRFIKWRASRGLLGMGIATSVFLSAIFLESSITKVFGGLVVNFIVAWMFVVFITPRWFPWLRAREN